MGAQHGVPTTDDYIWDQGASLPEVLQDTQTQNGTSTTTKYVYGLGLLAETSAGNTSYYLTDGLGSTVDLRDGSGGEIESYSYDEWGNPVTTPAQCTNQFRYTGQQQDCNANRGLYYLRARFYDPALGRFLSKDPLPFLQRYAYSGDNPTTYVDPSGRCWPQYVCRAGRELARAGRGAFQRVVDNVTNPNMVAGDVQLVAGFALPICAVGVIVGEGGIGAPVCVIAAGVTYGAAVAYQAVNADSTHETIVIVATGGLGLLPMGRMGEVIGDALQPLAAPGVAAAPGMPADQIAKEKPVTSGQ